MHFDFDDLKQKNVMELIEEVKKLKLSEKEAYKLGGYVSRGYRLALSRVVKLITNHGDIGNVRLSLPIFNRAELLILFKEFFTHHNQANEGYEGIDKLFNEWYDSKLSNEV